MRRCYLCLRVVLICRRGRRRDRAASTRRKARGSARVSTQTDHRLVTALVVLALWQASYRASPLFAALVLGLALVDRPAINCLNQRVMIDSARHVTRCICSMFRLRNLAYIAGFRQANGWLVIMLSITASAVILLSTRNPSKSAFAPASRELRFRSVPLAPSMNRPRQ